VLPVEHVTENLTQRGMKEHQRRRTKKKKKKLNLMREMLQRENLLPNDSISTICN
jgi:hypothetical protein